MNNIKDIQDKNKHFLLDTCAQIVDKINAFIKDEDKCAKDLISISYNLSDTPVLRLKCNTRLEYFAVLLSVSSLMQYYSTKKLDEQDHSSLQNSYNLMHQIIEMCPTEVIDYSDEEVLAISKVLKPPRKKDISSFCGNEKYPSGQENKSFFKTIHRLGHAKSLNKESSLNGYKELVLKQKLLAAWDIDAKDMLLNQFFNPNSFYVAVLQSDSSYAKTNTLMCLYENDHHTNALLELDFVFDLYEKINEHYKVLPQSELEKQRQIYKKEFSKYVENAKQLNESEKANIKVYTKYILSIIKVFSLYVKLEPVSNLGKKLRQLPQLFARDMIGDLSIQELALFNLTYLTYGGKIESLKEKKQDIETYLQNCKSELDSNSNNEENKYQLKLCQELLSVHNSLMQKLGTKDALKFLNQNGLMQELLMAQEIKAINATISEKKTTTTKIRKL